MKIKLDLSRGNKVDGDYLGPARGDSTTMYAYKFSEGERWAEWEVGIKVDCYR